MSAYSTQFSAANQWSCHGVHRLLSSKHQLSMNSSPPPVLPGLERAPWKITPDSCRQGFFSGQTITNSVGSSSLKSSLASIPLLFHLSWARTNCYFLGDWIPLSFFPFSKLFYIELTILRGEKRNAFFPTGEKVWKEKRDFSSNNGKGLKTHRKKNKRPQKKELRAEFKESQLVMFKTKGVLWVRACFNYPWV